MLLSHLDSSIIHQLSLGTASTLQAPRLCGVLHNSYSQSSEAAIRGLYLRLGGKKTTLWE